MDKDKKRLQQLEELEKFIADRAERRGTKYTKEYRDDDFIIASSK